MKLFGNYTSKKMPPEYLDFVADISTILNYGKYSAQVITSEPDWQGREGEHAFRYVANGTAWDFYQYFWINSGWVYMKWLGQATNSTFQWIPVEIPSDYYVALSDRQVQSINIAIAGVGSDNIAAQSILAAHLTAGEVVTLSAQIKDAIITNAKVNDLSANKINAGSIAVTVLSQNSSPTASERIVLDQNKLVVYDTAGNQRVILGLIS